MKGFVSFIVVASALAVLPALAQQQDFSKVEEQATPLGHNMFAITGAGGNTTVAVGSDAVIIVDTQYAPLYDRLKAKIAEVSGGKPIRYVIDTHYHGDHTGGNASFAHDGAILVAHENVAKRLANPLPGMTGQTPPPAPAEALPKESYSGDSHQVKIAGVTADLVHPAPAHTDGDSFVFWKAANVISTGDIVGSASYPNIDVAAGGGINGMIAAVDYLIAHADGSTRIVPGHGPVFDRNGKASGMNEQQVVDAHLLADLDAKWNNPASAFGSRFPRLIYQSVP
jgi:cyclase